MRNDEVPDEEYLEEPMPQMAKLQDAELTKWQLDALEQIENFKHSLKGEEYNQEKGVWISVNERRICNDQGAEALAAELQDRVHKLTFLSNLDKYQIGMLTYSFEINVARIIGYNYDKWKFNKAFLRSVRDRMTEFVFICYKKAEDKLTIGFLERAKMYLEKKNIIAGEPQKRSWLPFGG